MPTVVEVVIIFGLDAAICGTISSDLESDQIGLIGMDALLVALEAVDTFEVLNAIGTFPHGFVRMGKEMTTKMHWFAKQIAASSVRTRDRFRHPGSRPKRKANASLTAEKCFTLSSCKGAAKVDKISCDGGKLRRQKVATTESCDDRKLR